MLRPALVEAAESLLSESGRRVGPLAAMIMKANFNVRGRLTAYLFEGKNRRPRWVVKLARTRRARQVLLAERDAFESLLARSDFLRRQRPRLYSKSGDLAFVIEEFVLGGSVDCVGTGVSCEPLAVDWLAAFQSASADGALRKSDLLDRLERIRSIGGLEPFGELVDDAAARVGALADFEVAAVPVHGDFVPANLLLDGTRLYVTDWEWLRLGGWPLDDLWWFLLVSAKRGGSIRAIEGSDRVLDALTGSGPYAQRMRDVARGFASARGVPQDLVPVFAVITLLEMTVRWRGERIDWRTARSAEYERALVGLVGRIREFWDWWEGDHREGD